ncbi:MAG: M14 family zinc carboxypeptidase [Bacteroidota bacterium]
MKLRITLLLIAAIFTGFILRGQDIPEILKKRNEIFFSFEVKSTQEINTLGNLISIDNVKDKKVWAYANIEQYLKFLKLGYDITMLPPPGVNTEVEMTNHTVLSPLTTWNFYPTYTNYESLMAQFQTNYPNLCHLDTIATLASGRRLLVLKISDNVATDEAEPEFFYSSSIHGDETTGYILMLHLIDYLLSGYGSNPEVTDLINNMEIFVCPLANPDGTYYGGNTTVNGARRYNINGVDLNRNYPDPKVGQHPDGNSWQPETVAFMDFATQRHFVAACNFHGGSEVVNYPWDTWATLHADDNWFQYISREYADTVHLHAPAGYMVDLNNGVTNGYAWYEVNGGRQDYMNYYHHCREITIEISYTKLLPTSQLLAHWDYNWRSFILWMKEARYGVHGVITNQVTGSPVAAKVFIIGHDFTGSEVYSSVNAGDYHRPLKAGTYTFEFSAQCYQTQTIPGVVVNDHATVNLNIQLLPGASVTTAAVTSITGTTAISGGIIVCDAGLAISARGVCWSVSTNPVITGNHTVNGAGVGTFISQITGLSPNTAYHVRAYATNATGTVYGADILFTSACGAVASFPWNEGFENGGAIPSCWTQEQVSSSGVNWIFISGNGGSNPSTAHTGTYNACLKDVTTAVNKTRLITPMLELTSAPSPQLKFWHTQAVWNSRQDQLAVYYKTSVDGAWILLTTYTASIATWTQETINLPGSTATYYIAFEGNAKYGRGVCIDDVQVSSSCSALLPVSITIAADANPVFSGTTVNFAATAVNGGTAPAFQWFVNGATVTGATNSAFSYIPANNDLFSCILASNLLCTTGNPATSNTITMIVESVPLNREVQNETIVSGQTICYDALQTIMVAGNGTVFEIQPGGQATMIAGQTIQYLPGTIIMEGGFMHGYISPSGPYCFPQNNQPIETGTLFSPTAISDGKGFCRIYPNPTSGAVTLELSADHPFINMNAEVFTIRGEKIISTIFNSNEKSTLSLANYPNGVYVVRVSNGMETVSFKIIRLN